MHRAHHIRMRVERAARETDVRRPVLAEALHQLALARNRTDRQAAAERLAVGHHVGPHAEVFLRAAQSEAEADEHLVEDQHDAAIGADLAQLLQPRRVCSA